MAFRPLTDAECGQANPLVKLTSHLTHDHTFAETHGQLFANSSDQLVEQFLQETRAVPQTFRMDDLFREMHEIESQRAAIPPVPASTIKDQLNDDIWAQQYIDDGKHFNVHGNQEEVWAEIEGHHPQNFDHIWNNDLLQQNREELSREDTVKDALTVTDLDDPNLHYSKFMKFMKQVGSGELNIENNSATNDEAAAWGEEYLNMAAKADPKLLAENWSQEHAAVENESDAYNSNFWDRLQSEWRKLSEEESAGGTDTAHPWLGEYTEYYDPYKEYSFADSNPMFDVSDPMARGRQLREAGDLPSAVLCFEAAVRAQPENGEGWLLLGTTQAENEQDPNAICALKRCLELEQPEWRQAALMSLAVSYTNESYQHQACQSLVSWLRGNERYASLVPPDLTLSGQVTSILRPEQHRIVQDLFIKAAQLNPVDIDYEVQCGLGVLFNGSGEYDKAADCFRTALGVRPDDARLWNRLGATLANGSIPEDAVEAYHRALNLEPGFIRARYNVGITCINLGAHKEAAEHFLLALNQQARGSDVTTSKATGGGNIGKSQMSETIWSTLRMCVSLMNRPDLRVFVDNRDLGSLNDALQLHE